MDCGESGDWIYPTLAFTVYLCSFVLFFCCLGSYATQLTFTEFNRFVHVDFFSPIQTTRDWDSHCKILILCWFGSMLGTSSCWNLDSLAEANRFWSEIQYPGTSQEPLDHQHLHILQQASDAFPCMQSPCITKHGDGVYDQRFLILVLSDHNTHALQKDFSFHVCYESGT